jgi:hypothetical protein
MGNTSCTRYARYISEDAIPLREFKRKVCDNSKEVDSSNELEWYSLSIGFFLAMGLSVDQAYDYAIAARYDYKYWQ